MFEFLVEAHGKTASSCALLNTWTGDIGFHGLRVKQDSKLLTLLVKSESEVKNHKNGAMETLHL